MPEAIAISASATASPPSEQSWTAVAIPSRISAAHEIADALLVVEIDRRRRPLLAAGDLAQPDGLTEVGAPGGRRTDQQDRLVLGGERDPGDTGDVRHQSDAADCRGRRNGDAVGLVVERDIAGDDRKGEGLAGSGDPLDGADQARP